MATKDVPFSVSDSATKAILANGTFTVDEINDQVVGVSGSVGSSPITGLSSYNGASNALLKNPDFNSGGGYVYHYVVGSTEYGSGGVSFSAGGVDYSLTGSGPSVGRPPDAPTRFTASSGGSTVVSLSTPSQFQPVCFGTGTRIHTERGELAVEGLSIGDRAITAGGVSRPVRWIGRRTLDGNGRALPADQGPVRIRAGAFGHGLPVRDLLLSPGHPVLVGADADNEGGVLVPVMCLINGTTVAREAVSHVTYWHVELDSHGILLAEGLPAESYIDGGDRAFFTEGSDHALHNPGFVAPGWNGRCRPVAVEGPLVEAEQIRLNAVFAGTLVAQCGWSFTNEIYSS